MEERQLGTCRSRLGLLNIVIFFGGIVLLLKSLGKVFLKAWGGTAAALVLLVSFALLAEGVIRGTYYFNSRRFIHPYLGETPEAAASAD